ncbi:hypothetical protein F5Y12DRAFT_782436 [Xylaria sp. FL1777]|nr:hypothetical protein F5Y12DRAFT_782436 [Xylaria sp. FL1777]
MPGDIWDLSKRYDNSDEKPNPFNNRRTVEATILPFVAISWVCVVLRIHTRYRLKCLGWDDLFVILFRVSGTIGTASFLLLFNYGFGKHYWQISEVEQLGFRKTYYFALLSYVVSTTLTKLCLLTQYLRLFEDDRRARRACWFFIIMSAIWGVIFTVLAIGPCVPLSGFWDMEEDAHCYGFGSRNPDQLSATYAVHVTTNVILDLIVLAIPLPVYIKTFNQKKQRVAFSILILLGIAINVVSIVRIYTIIKTRAGTYPIPDPTFYAPQSVVLAALEVDLASIAASIPVFWPMLTNSWGKIFVTQEVHVTHHHRRLSGDFELPHFSPSRRTSHGRRDSDSSIKLVIMDSKELRPPRNSSAASSRVPLAERQVSYDTKDPYVRGRVYPLDGAMPASEAQVVSEGERGFRRNYMEHFGGRSPSLEINKPDDVRLSTEQGSSKDGDRAWRVSLSRKPSRRFWNGEHE